MSELDIRYPKTVEEMIVDARAAIADGDVKVIPRNEWALDLCERMLKVEQMLRPDEAA